MTKTDFNKFKKYIKKWRINLGITDWEIHVDMDDLEIDRVAQCAYENQNRCALITIDKNLTGMTDRDIEVAAVHELLELTMADVRVSLCAWYNESLVDQQIHRVIRRLENALK